MSSRALKLALVTRWYPPLIGGAERVLSYLAGSPGGSRCSCNGHHITKAGACTFRARGGGGQGNQSD